jgi:hypothetical protein
MGLHVDVITKKEPINWGLTIFGLIFFTWRAFTLNSLKIIGGYVENANYVFDDSLILDPYALFMPDVLHVSYIISLTLGLCLIFNFRVKVFNAVPVLVLPSVLITIPFKDFPILLKGPETVGWLYWLNYMTIHIPVLIFGLYILLMRNHYLSKASFMIAFFGLNGWFFAIDNKVNGVLDIFVYVIVGLIVAFFWLIICFKFVLNDCDSKLDPFFCPIILPTKIYWAHAKAKNKNGEVKNI